MRKAQKQQLLGVTDSLHQIHEKIKEALGQGNVILAQDMISQTQNSAISLGENIEKTEGEGHITVSYIEEYCEFLFCIYEDINKNDWNAKKAYKALRKQLIKIENSIKNDIADRTEIVFFSYKASMWDSLESIYLAAKADLDCDVYCVPIPYYTLNPDQSFGEMHYEGGEYPEDIEITDWQEYNFEERRPDVVYIHNPYDNYNLVTSVHPRFYSNNLRKYTDTLVYVPYYMTSGGMSEGQRFIPSYMNMDYIVIQSSKFREYFDARVPDEKFLPLGSPKADRVIRKCQNPPVLPKEWQLSDAQLEKIAEKKIYFYNTSIAGMLADTETFLKKMQYVFRCFEEHDNAYILWRPHPLLEATFHSMRPQYWPAFEELKRNFLNKGIGVLDTTADIERAIALSDAYIGDAGTSVTALFGVAGKPIFILNNKILEEPEEGDWRKKFHVEFAFYYQNRSAVIQGKKLYISEPHQYHYRYFCDLPEYVRDNRYIITSEMNGKWYACPLNAQDILVIGQNGIEKKIELKKSAGGNPAFSLPQKYDKYLFLLPANYPAVVRYDTVTGEINYFTENIDGYVKEKNNQKITGGSLVYQGNLYIASPTDNMVYRLNIESGQSSIIDLPIKSRCGSSIVVDYKDEIWLMPYDGQVIVRWDPKTNKTREYEGFPKDFLCRNPADGSECMEKPFSIPAFWDNYIYLPAFWANMSLKLNMDTGEFERWAPIFEEEEIENENLKRNDSYMFLDWKLREQEKEFKIFSFVRNRIYNMSCDGTVFRELEIQFDMEEMENSEPGFCECSEVLPYACIENYFNTLNRLLSGSIVGNQFIQEKQLMAYGKIVANYNGECGKKVHDFVKKIR